jgi:hypothetical protein
LLVSRSVQQPKTDGQEKMQLPPHIFRISSINTYRRKCLCHEQSFVGGWWRPLRELLDECEPPDNSDAGDSSQAEQPRPPQLAYVDLLDETQLCPSCRFEHASVMIVATRQILCMGCYIDVNVAWCKAQQDESAARVRPMN